MIIPVSVGGGLNLKIVDGTTQPTSPKKNTVWVNTDIDIHSYAFSATQPYRVSKNKNRIIYPYLVSTFSHNGVEYTVNSDGSVTANGTAGEEQSRVDLLMWDDPASGIVLEPGTYFVSGCPAGGGTSTYNLQVVVTYDNGANFTWLVEYGNGLTLNITAPAKVRIGIRVAPNATVSNIVFKPQLEKGSTATSFVKGDATGMVWFKTTERSSAAMNIDKKNTVMLYPGGCSQYIGGAWVSKDAQSFIGGKWVDWRIYFYNKGDECTDLTGGWLAMGNLANSSGQGTAITPTITRNADSMLITFNGAQYGVGHVYTQNRIDLTEFKTITIEGESACTNTNPNIKVASAEPAAGKYWPNVGSVDLPKTGAFKISLDVSALSGLHFIAVGFYNTASATSTVTMFDYYGEV